MDKDKLTKLSDTLRDKLEFLKQEEDYEDELQVEEKSLSSGDALKKDLPEGDLKEKLERNRIRKFRMRVTIGAIAAVIVMAFFLYNKLYTFTDYVIAESFDNTAAAGSDYVAVGKNLYRYNSDGVSCVTRENEMLWSITYNMQAPIVDVCGETMVIAEQQGNQIYVVNQDGLVGNFESLLPILKVRVSKQGVVAAVLQEDDITWVNLYKADGTSIADDKTTVAESGYPLDIDLSPNGEKLAVSYLGVQEGNITTNVIFYHFGSAGQSQKNNVVSSTTFVEKVVPEIYFNSNSEAVAVTDEGFVVFKGNDTPEPSVEVTFDEEIVSAFHDENRIGFLFNSEEEGYRYRMELYTYNGKKKTTRQISADFDNIKIENEQILMYGDKNCDIFTLSGQKRFSSAYEKDIANIFYFSEYRKYLVITNDSFDRIRIS